MGCNAQIPVNCTSLPFFQIGQLLAFRVVAVEVRAQNHIVGVGDERQIARAMHLVEQLAAQTHEITRVKSVAEQLVGLDVHRFGWGHVANELKSRVFQDRRVLFERGKTNHLHHVSRDERRGNLLRFHAQALVSVNDINGPLRLLQVRHDAPHLFTRSPNFPVGL